MQSPALGRGKPRYGYRKGPERLGGSSAAKVLADHELNVTEQSTLAAIRVNNTPGA